MKSFKIVLLLFGVTALSLIGLQWSSLSESLVTETITTTTVHHYYSGYMGYVAVAFGGPSFVLLIVTLFYLLDWLRERSRFR